MYSLDPQRLDVRLCDFGLTRDTLYVPEGGSTALPLRYMPPEAILQRRFSSASDVWSFGVLLWELFTHSVPYAVITDDIQLAHQICEQGLRLDQPEGCPEMLYQLMQQCWAHGAEDRPSFKQLRQQLRQIVLALHHTRDHSETLREGLAVERECTNNNCASCGAMVLCPLGFGQFDMGEELVACPCPSCGCGADGSGTSPERIWVRACKWTCTRRQSCNFSVLTNQGNCGDTATRLDELYGGGPWRSMKLSVGRRV